MNSHSKQRKYLRLLYYALPIIFSIMSFLCSMIFPKSKAFITLTSLFGAAYLIYCAWYVNYDHGHTVELECLQKDNDNLVSLLQSLHKLISSSIRNIETGLPVVYGRGDNSGHLSFSSISTVICLEMYDHLRKLLRIDDHFAFNIYQKFEDNGKTYGIMIAHEGHRTNPDSYNVPVNLSSPDLHQCFRTLRDNDHDYVIYLDKKVVAKAFGKKLSDCKYSQYVGIPVSDASGNVVALLEIIILDDFRPFDSKNDIMNLLKDHVSLYKDLCILTLRIEEFSDSSKIAQSGGFKNEKKKK